MKKLLRCVINSKSGRCFFAGLWFAAAAVIPVAYYIFRFGDALPIFGSSPTVGFGFPVMLIPISLAGIVGALLGSTILDAAEVETGFQASLRGLMTAMLAFLLLFAVPFLISVYASGAVLEITLGFAIFFLYGLFIVGWLVAVVGAATGSLLYLLRLSAFEDEKNF